MNDVLSTESTVLPGNQLDAGSIIIGTIIDFDAQGRPLVDYASNPDKLPKAALTTQALSQEHISRQVALLFNAGDLSCPVIMGLIYNPLDEVIQNFELTPTSDESSDPFPECEDDDKTQATVEHAEDNKVYVDGKHVVIEGSEEVSFKCGKASITLQKSGKILIRGTYLLNRSSGVNRIMGGSVQVN